MPMVRWMDASSLRGKPLTSRRSFLVKRATFALAYLLVLASVLIVAVVSEQVLFAGIGLTLLAVGAAIAVELIGEGLFELPRLFSYRAYRQRWEQANEVPSHE